MSITLFHLGPGAAIKALIPQYFSLTVFTLVQFIIDAEVVYLYFVKSEVTHRYLHSYAGASAVVLFCVIFGKHIAQLWLKLWNKLIAPGRHSRLYINDSVGFKSVLYAAIFGAYFHIFIDSLIYSDMQPLYPWSSENGLYGTVNMVALHFTLLVLGTIGIFWLLIHTLTNKFKN